MKHVDIISKYLEALHAGNTHEEAELLAKSWAEAMEMHPEAASKQDLINMMHEIKTQFTIVKVIGGAMFVVVCIPILQKLFGN